MFKQLWAKYWTWRATDGKIVHTIVIARVKLFAGTIFTAVQQSGIDVASLVTANDKVQVAIKVLFAWLIIDGTLAEWGRRHKADDLA